MNNSWVNFIQTGILALPAAGRLLLCLFAESKKTKPMFERTNIVYTGLLFHWIYSSSYRTWHIPSQGNRFPLDTKDPSDLHSTEIHAGSSKRLKLMFKIWLCVVKYNSNNQTKPIVNCRGNSSSISIRVCECVNCHFVPFEHLIKVTWNILKQTT